MRAVAGRRSWDVKNSRVEEEWRLHGPGCQLFAHTWTPPRANVDVESIFQLSAVDRSL